MSSNSLFLRECPLRLNFRSEKLGDAILLLDKVKESYRIFLVQENNGYYTDLYVFCDSRGFANCYFYIGQLFERAGFYSSKTT